MEIKKIFSIFVAASGFMNLFYGIYNFQGFENSLIMSSLSIGCILISIGMSSLFWAKKSHNINRDSNSLRNRSSHKHAEN